MTKTEPQVGIKVRATTTTSTEQAVVVEVTAIDREVSEGWYVWGYRQASGRRRSTFVPRLYFVGRA